MDRSQMLRLRQVCGRVFSPAAPIDTIDLFTGRAVQLKKVVDAVSTRGQHAIIYGERGVGKTSLANVLKDMLSGGEDATVIKVNCVQEDTYEGAWRNALADMAWNVEVGDGRVDEYRLSQYLPEHFGPGDVRRVLQPLVAPPGNAVVIFDEFDRLRDRLQQGLFADTIKDLSDNSVRVTLVLVGVADDVDQLIAEHASIDRALLQIPMPRMSQEELQEIIHRAMTTLEMTIDADGLELIVLLSQGLPHYTHLIGKQSTLAAIDGDRGHITAEDVQAGIRRAVEDSQQSIQSAYKNATSSPRKDTLFSQVLLACALAKGDENGYFASADVRAPLNAITDKDYDIPNFSPHLDKFCNEEVRGQPLEKAGTARRFRFRFRNPLLQPYVIMKGLASGTMTGRLLELLRQSRG